MTPRPTARQWVAERRKTVAAIVGGVLAVVVAVSADGLLPASWADAAKIAVVVLNAVLVYVTPNEPPEA